MGCNGKAKTFSFKPIVYCIALIYDIFVFQQDPYPKLATTSNMMGFRIILALAIVVVALQLATTVDAECCSATMDVEYIGFGQMPSKCGDNTEPTPCCGYGPCNIFCCNCDGGCRSSRRRSNPDEIAANDLATFGEIDLNKDGKVDADEAHKFVAPKNLTQAFEFARYDLNGDGFLSLYEVSGAR
jgi:hypothetical protein